jgi:hypothetical protein
VTTEEVEAVNPLSGAIGEIAQIVIDIVGPILIMLVSWAVWKLAGKFGLEKNVKADELLRRYVQEGIDWADSWAKKQTEKPTGEAKYAEAVKYIVKMVGESEMPNIAEAKLKELVEAYLEKKNAELAAPSA